MISPGTVSDVTSIPPLIFTEGKSTQFGSESSSRFPLYFAIGTTYGKSEKNLGSTYGPTTSTDFVLFGPPQLVVSDCAQHTVACWMLSTHSTWPSGVLSHGTNRLEFDSRIPHELRDKTENNLWQSLKTQLFRQY